MAEKADADSTDAQELYNISIVEYENIIKNFTYKCVNVGDCENVYLVEDSFVIYIGLVKGGENPWHWHKLIFEEFSYNELYKFNISEFSRKITNNNIYIIENDIVYKKFNGSFGRPILEKRYFLDGPGAKSEIIIPSQADKIHARYPGLKIKERYDWTGFLYNFIVFELTDVCNIGHAICKTTIRNAHSVAQKKGDDVEMCAVMNAAQFKKFGHTAGGEWLYNGVECNQAMMKLLVERIEVNKAEGWASKKAKQRISNKLCLAEKDMKYFIVQSFIKNKDDIYQTQKEIFADVERGLYSHLERHEYLVLDKKWKSEQFVFELARKLFKKRTVLYQHRPFFLGKLSYDIFVCGENIAIEYQGKQHFEPISIFGGEKSFEAQKERDMLKAKMSEENGVRLIYVNYWEDISIDLLKEKINPIN